MIPKNLTTINKNVLTSIKLGEDFFLSQIITSIEKTTKSSCKILKLTENNEYKQFPIDNTFQLQLLDPVKAFMLDNPEIEFKSVARLDKITLERLANRGFINKIDANKRIILKSIQSVNDKRSLNAILIIEKRLKNDEFSQLDMDWIEYYRDILTMASGIFENETRIKHLKTINKTLSKMVTINFPNVPTNLLNINSAVEVAYLVMDIRNSTDLNFYLKERGGVEKVTDFYKSFSKFCNNIAVNVNACWFRKQIGDSFHFAWTGKNAKYNAVKTAVEIHKNFDKIRRKNRIPINLGVGVGLAYGKVIPDYQIGELKGDAPREAFEFQENSVSIYSGFEMDEVTHKFLKNNRFGSYLKSLTVRGKMLKAYEICAKKEKKFDIKLENTIESLVFSNRLAGDLHIHLEGTNVYSYNFLEYFNKSAATYINNSGMLKNLERVINNTLTNIVDQFLASIKTKKDKTFTFQEFLTKLYCTKIVLSADVEIVERFVKSILNDYFNKYCEIRLGITASLPSDLRHINRELWNQTIAKAIHDSIKKHQTKKFTLVLETKRQHLTEKDGNKYIYEHNLEFLKTVLEKNKGMIDVAISIGDDAILYPLFNKERLAQFENYLDFIKSCNKISLSLHMLENLPGLSSVDASLIKKVVNNPLYEFDCILDVLDKRHIYGVSLIHMCNLFNNANPNVEYRNNIDDQNIDNGLKRLLRLGKRNDRIVVCLTSNLSLNNPFLLDYPEIIKVLIKGEINIALGSDDPGAFKIKDIADELNRVHDRIIEIYKYGMNIDGKYFSANDLATLVKYALVRNSWEHWNYLTMAWEDIKGVEIRKLGFDVKTFKRLLHFDIEGYNRQTRSVVLLGKILKKEKLNFI